MRVVLVAALLLAGCAGTSYDNATAGAGLGDDMGGSGADGGPADGDVAQGNATNEPDAGADQPHAIGNASQGSNDAPTQTDNNGGDSTATGGGAADESGADDGAPSTGEPSTGPLDPVLDPVPSNPLGPIQNNPLGPTGGSLLG